MVIVSCDETLPVLLFVGDSQLSPTVMYNELFHTMDTSVWKSSLVYPTQSHSLYLLVWTTGTFGPHWVLNINLIPFPDVTYWSKTGKDKNFKNKIFVTFLTWVIGESRKNKKRRGSFRLNNMC